VVITVDGTETARFDADGHFGSGATSPAAAVHAVTDSNEAAIIVQGNTTGSSTSGTGSTLAFKGNQGSGNPWEIYRDNGSSGDLIIAVDNSGTRIDAMSVDLANQDFRFNSGFGSVATAYGCRAWVNFDGTGTPSIRADGNVSSITDVAQGLYNVNFSSNMPDADYASVVTSGPNATNSPRTNASGTGTIVAPTTSQFRIRICSESGSELDVDYIHAAVFR